MHDEERSGYPPYSPDLAPSDYHLFLRLKEFLARKILRGDQDTKDFVQEWLNVLTAPFCDERLQKLVPQYIECLNTGCPRRNVRDFGRVFLMLNYTDITHNTYIQS